MEPQFSKNTLFNFFAGHATPLQKKVIEEWLEEEANRELFFEWLKEWEDEHPQFMADPEAGFRKFQAKSRGVDIRVQPTITRGCPGGGLPPVPLPLRWCWYSLPRCGFGRDAIRYRNYHTAFGEIRTLTPGRREPRGAQRQFFPAGAPFRVRPGHPGGSAGREAQFLVRHTPTDQKFIVRTPDRMAVEVLGTEFVVYSRKRGSRVILQKGSVQLRNAANRVISVAPGDVVTLDKKGVFQKKSQQPVQNYSAWKENRFVFDRTSLREVAQLIAENFGTRVRIPIPRWPGKASRERSGPKMPGKCSTWWLTYRALQVIRSGGGYLLQPALEE
jgi:hypothetical protein